MKKLIKQTLTVVLGLNLFYIYANAIKTSSQIFQNEIFMIPLVLNKYLTIALGAITYTQYIVSRAKIQFIKIKYSECDVMLQQISESLGYSKLINFNNKKNCIVHALFFLVIFVMVGTREAYYMWGAQGINGYVMMFLITNVSVIFMELEMGILLGQLNWKFTVLHRLIGRKVRSQNGLSELKNYSGVYNVLHEVSGVLNACYGRQIAAKVLLTFVNAVGSIFYAVIDLGLIERKKSVLRIWILICSCLANILEVLFVVFSFSRVERQASVNISTTPI